MKKIVSVLLFLTAAAACSFGKSEAPKWESRGDVRVSGDTITLSGEGSGIVLSGGESAPDYKNFELSVKAKTASGGKGFLAFHTDDSLVKGYKIAINNDLEHPIWWRMTGSIMTVRNLAKSLAQDGEWFDLKVTVDGANVKVWVGDTLVADYIEPEKPFRLPVEKDTVLSSGTFAFANVSDGLIQLKDFQLKKLPENGNVAKQRENAIDEQKDDVIKLHQADFPVLDYHVHLKGDLANNDKAALEQSRRYGINYAIAPNCGKDFPIKNDAQVMEYLKTHRSLPFILAMQAEGREWVTTFSPEVRAEFDYVFTDGMTFTDDNGKRVHLWIKEEVDVKDEEAYMDKIVDVICGVVKEPADVYANALYLPDVMQPNAKKLWTKERREKVLNALVEGGMVLEIGNLYNTPDKEFILAAKERGVKFTFGSNNGNSNFGKLEYPIKMIKECRLTPADMYKPKIKLN